MQIKKSYLEVLYLVLKETELNLAGSRTRDNFLKKLEDPLNTYYTDRTKIYTEYCNKKEDGTPDTEDGLYHFNQEVKEALVKELDVLNNEVVELSAPEELKDIIEKTNYKPKVGEVEAIDEILKNL